MVVVKAWGLTEGILLNAEAFGAEVAETEGGVPKKLGRDMVVVKVWGLTGGILLNTEAFGGEVADTRSGVPTRVGWVGVGALAGRWISGIG